MHQQVSIVASVLVVTTYIFLFVSVEVLLDMSASGSELGWLTLPYENGVSIYTSTGIFKTSGSTLETVFLCVDNNWIKGSWGLVHERIWILFSSNDRGLCLLIQPTKKLFGDRWNEWQLDEVWQGSASLALTLPFHKELMNAIKMSRFNLHLNLQYQSAFYMIAGDGFHSNTKPENLDLKIFLFPPDSSLNSEITRAKWENVSKRDRLVHVWRTIPLSIVQWLSI